MKGPDEAAQPPEQGGAPVARTLISLGFAACEKQLPAGFDWLAFVRALVAAVLSCGRFGAHPMLVSWRTRGNSIGTRIFGLQRIGKFRIPETQMGICLNILSHFLLKRSGC